MDEGVVEDNEDDVMMQEDEFGEEELRMAEASEFIYTLIWEETVCTPTGKLYTIVYLRKIDGNYNQRKPFDRSL